MEPPICPITGKPCLAHCPRRIPVVVSRQIDSDGIDVELFHANRARVRAAEKDPDEIAATNNRLAMIARILGCAQPPRLQ